MASLSQIIFCSMVSLIVLFSVIIILILGLTFTSLSPEIMSINAFPIGNIGEDILLSCILHSRNTMQKLSRVSVTWEKRESQGFVYEYKDGHSEFSKQNEEFQGRTELFPSMLVEGNASLLLRNIRLTDEGIYTCSISSSDGGGKINLHFRTAAYTAPTFTFSNGTLAAQASRWFPEPNVTWYDHLHKVLQAKTSLFQNPARIFSVNSKLQMINSSEIYTCQIRNSLVNAVSTVKITDSDVSESTYFTFSTAPSSLASTYLLLLTAVLCIYCLF